MVRFNFDEAGDVRDFEPLPDGQYQVELADIALDQTRKGDPMWKLKFAVVDGPHAGRFVFDNLIFSKAAAPRVKLICSALGLDTSGEIDLTPELLLGRRCAVMVHAEEYEDYEGYTKTRNQIPYNGYEAVPESAPSTPSLGEGPLPY